MMAQPDMKWFYVCTSINQKRKMKFFCTHKAWFSRISIFKIIKYACTWLWTCLNIIPMGLREVSGVCAPKIFQVSLKWNKNITISRYSNENSRIHHSTGINLAFGNKIKVLQQFLSENSCILNCLNIYNNHLYQKYQIYSDD